jgi:uncharacterized membrane protein
MSSVDGGASQETILSDEVRWQERRDRRAARRKPRAIISLTLVMVDLVLLGMTVCGVHGPGRLVLGLILGFLIPGWALVGLLKLGNAWLEVSLTLAVSLALLMVVAQILITANTWHLVAFEDVVCVACLPSLVWQSQGRPIRRRLR